MPLGTDVGLGPGGIVFEGDPAPPTERGTAVSHFPAHFALTQSPISATAKLLSYLPSALMKFFTVIILI